VKIFITHGGLLSAQEAAYHGKTLIGIPIFGDQMLNVKRAQLGGYAVLLDFKNITKASVKSAIYEAINNKEYVLKSIVINGKLTSVLSYKKIES
jgi:glucuronosyltransferase